MNQQQMNAQWTANMAGLLSGQKQRRKRSLRKQRSGVSFPYIRRMVLLHGKLCMDPTMPSYLMNSYETTSYHGQILSQVLEVFCVWIMQKYITMRLSWLCLTDNRSSDRFAKTLELYSLICHLILLISILSKKHLHS